MTSALSTKPRSKPAKSASKSKPNAKKSKSGQIEKLTRDRIIKKALSLVRKDGLQNLTMRRLADELDVATMATYRHFENRDALVIALVDEVCRKRLACKPEKGSTWQEQVRRQAAHSFETFIRYEGLPEYIVKYGPHTENGLRVINVWLTILTEAGFSEEDAVYTFQTIGMLVASTVEFSKKTRGGKASWTYINRRNFPSEMLTDLPAIDKSIDQFDHSQKSIVSWCTEQIIVALERKQAG
ncbi:MAG: TetR/AcrR family transcriptional regulator C-terminal domain-containing protein [Pseudomonadota bacterium]